MKHFVREKKRKKLKEKRKINTLGRTERRDFRQVNAEEQRHITYLNSRSLIRRYKTET